MKFVHVVELNIYPVKSTRPISRSSSAVERWGLAGDRRWMVVDAENRFISARKVPALLGVTATPSGPGRVRLAGPHAAPLDVDASSAAELVPVTVWKDEVLAVAPSSAADTWFSSLLDCRARLVWLDDPARRAVNAAYGKPGDLVSFADGFPLLLACTGSLRQLNDWIDANALELGESPPEQLTMRRFRPNVVIDNDEPFAEDRWRRLRIGEVDFRLVKLCGRCVLTTIDPLTLVKGKEPLRTLARHRRWDGEVWFGVNVIPDAVGTLNVGDEVTILDEATRPDMVPEVTLGQAATSA